MRRIEARRLHLSAARVNRIRAERLRWLIDASGRRVH